jgi:hypothetical protein
MGPNLLRNFSSLPNCSAGMWDSSAERRAFVHSNFLQGGGGFASTVLNALM